MAPLDLAKVLAKIEHITEEQQARALADLSGEELHALHEQVAKVDVPWGNLDLEQVALRTGMPLRKLETFFLHYDEQIKHMSSHETDVDRFMKQTAHVIPPTAVQGITECRKQSKELRSDIFSSFEALKTMLAYHEDLIRKRWSKKSRAQKREILLIAWPGMSARHRPDMDENVYLQDSTAAFANPEEAFASVAWPYINLEDLLEPKALLMFMNTRGRNHPDKFAHADLELAPVFKLGKAFLALRQDHCTMMILGESSAETYGEVIEWDSASATRESIKTGRAVHLEHGLQILTIQRRIWLFLHKCAALILADGPHGSPPKGSAPQIEPPPLTNNEGSLISLNIVARELPYRLPSQLDLPRLEALACAQKHQAIDHAIALREDPGYFVEVTEKYLSHRAELVLDAQGKQHVNAKDYPMYNKAQRQLAADSHCAVFIWHEIHERIMKLRTLSSKYSGDISVEKDLPDEFFEALVEARYFLEYISLDLISIVNAEYRASPPLRSSHFLNPTNSAGYHIMPILDCDVEDTVLKQVLRLLKMLTDKGVRDLFSLHAILDELERLMQAEPRAKALITPHLASTLSQLSIMSECLHQLHQFQPWAQKIESTIEEHGPRYMAAYDTIFRHWGAINNIYDKFVTPQLFKVGNPKDGKFFYPAEKRRTRETVRSMIAAEAALEAFWTAANAHFRRYIGTSPVALVKHIIGDRTLQRTPPWTESPRLAPRNAAERETFTPFAGHLHDVSSQITGNFKKLAISSQDKKKTRRIDVGNAEAEPTTDTVQHITATAPPTAVGKRALKVFNSLFHSPSSPDQSGEVAWPDFLHAMVKAGFSAEKLQGSAWHFSPQTIDVNRSIQFHEPHPSNKLPFTWARCYGRRLTRAFGWTRESFTLV